MLCVRGGGGQGRQGTKYLMDNSAQSLRGGDGVLDPPPFPSGDAELLSKTPAAC